jgi:hypothetical protein
MSLPSMPMDGTTVSAGFKTGYRLREQALEKPDEIRRTDGKQPDVNRGRIVDARSSLSTAHSQVSRHKRSQSMGILQPVRERTPVLRALTANQLMAFDRANNRVRTG